MNSPRLLLLASLLLLPACSEAGGSDDFVHAAPVVSPRVDRPAFQADRAYSLLLRQVSFGPRVPGMEGHRAQLEWMKGYLAERADTVVEQPFTHVTAGGERLELTNLMARFRPEVDERILLLAHWDTRPRADQAGTAAEREQAVPGANDGASGTAVLLELAELFREQPPRVGVDLLFVDGEDYGPESVDMYLGAKHFAANLNGYSPMYGVLLDMVGDRDLRFPVEAYSQQYAPGVVQRVWGLARELGYGHVFVPEDGGAISDDHLPLNEAGIPTIDVIDFHYGPGHRYWHTLEDVPENTSAESLGIVGDVIAELVYRGG